MVQFKPDLSGYLWDNFFSECPFLGITKNIFFNDYVKSKGNYVGNFSFYLCAYLEFFILDTLDSLVPDLIPDGLNTICQRWFLPFHDHFNIYLQNSSEKEKTMLLNFNGTF